MTTPPAPAIHRRGAFQRRALIAAAVLAASTPAAARADADAAVDGGPTAGFRDGLFFLRDRSDAFRLYPRGRLQIDAHTHFGHDLDAAGLEDALVFRRIQPEISGEVEHVVTFTLGAAWESASLAAPAGVSARARADAGQARPSPRGLRSIPADAFVNFGPLPVFNVQVGQFDEPFMLDNRTSDEITPFLERSMAARSLGVPRNKGMGVMLWGEPESRVARYELGAFLADGTDGGFHSGYDVTWRTLLRPVFFVPLVRDFSMGLSLRWGTRSRTENDVAMEGFTTQGNYEYWAPTYVGSRGLVETIASGASAGRGVELHWPVMRLEPTFEWIDVRTETREHLAGAASSSALRHGDLDGQAWYFTFGLWVLGKQDLPGTLGIEPIPRADLLSPERPRPLHALEILFRHEHLSARDASASAAGAPDPHGIDGTVHANANGAGANFWWTQLVRLTADYAFTEFTSPETGRGATLRSLHELSFRVAVGL